MEATANCVTCIKQMSVKGIKSLVLGRTKTVYMQMYVMEAGEPAYAEQQKGASRCDAEYGGTAGNDVISELVRTAVCTADQNPYYPPVVMPGERPAFPLCCTYRVMLLHVQS